MSSLRLLFEILFSRPGARLLLMLCSLMSASFGLLAAFTQKEFVDHLMGISTASYGVELHPVAWLGLGFLFLLLTLILSQTVNYVGAKESLLMQRHLADRLYGKVLRLQASDLRGRSVGEIVSIYTGDIPGATVLLEQSLPQGFGILFPLILAPWALITLFHIPASIVLGLLAVVLVINLALAFRQSRFFFHFKKLAADRVGLVNEWVQNIRTLRVLGLTEAFENKIIQVRKVETKNRIGMLTNGQSMNAISSSMTFLINVILVVVLVRLQPGAVTPGSLLAMLWIVGIFLTRPFRQLPWFFTFVFDGWTSLRRVARALDMTSIDPQIAPVPSQPTTSPSAELRSAQTTKTAQILALQVDDLNLRIQSVELLKNINLEIKSGEFIAIVGEVGSGKSLLLQSLLAETPATFGRYQILGKDMSTISLNQMRSQFAFVPQEGFTMSASLLENVAFDYDLTNPTPEIETRVKNALRLSEFQADIDQLPAGLKTEIGERGVNLSGGQKQRISLARAVYSDAPILLLDDTFSALDTDTETLLIQGLFSTEWKERTRILVTHRLTILPKANRIYFMQEGRIVDVGTWDELLIRSADFRLFVQSVKSREVAAPRSPEPRLPEAEPVTTDVTEASHED